MWRRLCWKAPRNQRVCGYAQTPEPPYFAVIFTSERTSTSEGYEATAQQMLQLARRQPGFLGVESARESLGITVSYWASEEAIAAWKANVKHLVAQEKGKRLAGSRRGLQRGSETQLLGTAALRRSKDSPRSGIIRPGVGLHNLFAMRGCNCV
ncbi:unnamed protein product [Effrenium voratum]|nr:unnamed protein product [Effrenium voratum]CAJ1415173.1 unnamed protein product [Effrenium voratum]